MADVDSALRELRMARDQDGRIYAIHYACENFHEVKGAPPSVTCIVVREWGPTGQVHLFSITNSLPDEERERRETELLERFYSLLRSHPDVRLVHWNMNAANYSFNALADRYRHLARREPEGAPSPDRVIDLDALVAQRYGEGYAAHPKLSNLASLNNIFMRFFMPGLAEAEAAKANDFSKIDRSTSEKTRIILELLRRFLDGSLNTRNSVGEVTFAKRTLDAVDVVLTIGERLLDISRSLRRRRAGKSTIELNDEYDYQDLLGSLLRMFFEDVRAEETTPSYAGASSRIDFVIPRFGLAIELKASRESLSDKKVGEELMIDRERYAANNNVRHLICLVFDHEGWLTNPRGLEADLSREASTAGLAVTARIYDR